MGCRKDGIRMNDFLQKRGFAVSWLRDFKINLNRDGRVEPLEYDYPWFPSADNIRKTIKRIVAEQKRGDVFWFQYSGHGGQLPDDNKDEKDGKDEVLVSADYKHRKHKICFCIHCILGWR